MAKILVTGGAGFLGSHIVDVLVQRGHQVTVFDRTRSQWAPQQVPQIVGDLLDERSLAAALVGQDVVYHLAGFADLNAAKSQPLETVRTNVFGTVQLLETMRAAGVGRLIFASTAYVYSREGGFYRCSKQACENYIEEFSRVFGTKYTVVRFGSLYGPRTDATNGVHRLLRAAMTEGQINYSGAPDDLREYIHVEDAASLSADVLDDRFNGEHVMLTGNTGTRAAELFTMFQEILGRRIEIQYAHVQGPGSGHYAVTPYAFTPRPGRKLVTTSYIDMGQGLLRMVEEIHDDLERRNSHE